MDRLSEFQKTTCAILFMLIVTAGCGGFFFGLYHIVSAIGPLVVLCLVVAFVPVFLWAGTRLDAVKDKIDRKAVESRANPYEEANQEIATALGAGEPPVTRFAPFLSYKSVDAQTVRFVAEQLIGAGHLPWFNEYVIMLEDRSQFLNAINRGIEQADSAVIVSNTDYRGSDHCIHELRRLLGPTGCGANRLLEVHKPHDPELRAQFPELNGVPSVAFNDQYSLLNDVCTWMNIPAIEVEPITSTPKGQYVNHKLALAMDLSGWKLRWRGGLRLKKHEYVGPVFDAEFGEHTVGVNVQIGPSGTTRPAAQTYAEEHRYFEQLAEFGAKYTRTEKGRECVGVHSLRAQGLVQFGLTYYMQRGWIRKYSVDLPPIRNRPTLEYVFTFRASCSFREFCRLAYRFDHVVASVKRPES